LPDIIPDMVRTMSDGRDTTGPPKLVKKQPKQKIRQAAPGR
jgi:hypothetical protein